ncbi:hypothetical protein Tco_1170584 [Tanacetum coccineum]
MNDIVSSDEEWEESDYVNPHNTTTDSSFKPYLNAQEKDDVEKEDERSQKKRKGNNNILNKAPKSDNQNNEQPSKRDLDGKEIDKVGKVSIIWNPMCVVVMPLSLLRASVSVLCPLSTYLNLGLGELAHTKLTVELANKTVKHPKGIAENVLVGIVGKYGVAYRDQDMGDVIFGEPFCKASCVEAEFDGFNHLSTWY